MADHAVLIGVEPYAAGFQELRGTGNDAREFARWLVAADGGGVPEANVHCASTPCPPHEPPTQAGIRKAFRPLLELVSQDGPQEDRLFIYASGHGLGDMSNAWDTGLITADADLTDRVHVAVNRYADFMFRTQRFKQVIFLTDCCRDIDPQWPIGPPQLPRMMQPPAAVPPRKFFGAAANWGVQAKEGQFDGVWHGYFTKALLEALEHVVPASRDRIAGDDVARYMHARIATWQSRTPVLPIPEFAFDSVRDVDFGHVRGRPFPVRIEVDAAFDGKRALLLFDGRGTPVDERILAAGTCTWGMKPGLYRLEVENTAFSTLVDVPREAPVHVR